MSQNALESVLVRAMSDQAFAGLDLTPEETALLKAMSPADFNTLAQATPEERKSFASFHPVPGIAINHNESMLPIPD